MPAVLQSEEEKKHVRLLNGVTSPPPPPSVQTIRSYPYLLLFILTTIIDESPEIQLHRDML
jgi:hypothetical protein